MMRVVFLKCIDYNKHMLEDYILKHLTEQLQLNKLYGFHLRDILNKKPKFANTFS